MTHGRKPRKPRHVRLNTMWTAQLRASRLTDDEIASIMNPVRECYAHVRTATATEIQFNVLHTSLVMAQEIEKTGIVRGLIEHIELALAASTAYCDRSLTLGAWHPSACHFHELDALSTMVELHEYQLKQLSSAELHRITQRLIAQTKQAGGQAFQASADLRTTTKYTAGAAA